MQMRIEEDPRKGLIKTCSICGKKVSVWKKEDEEIICFCCDMEEEEMNMFHRDKGW